MENTTPEEQINNNSVRDIERLVAVENKLHTYLHKLLDHMLEKNYSDLYLIPDNKVSFRLNESIAHCDEVNLTEDMIDNFTKILLRPNEFEEFQKKLEMNSAYDYKNTRFRVNCFYQKNMSSIVIRKISSVIPTPEVLGLPEIYKTLILKKRGLILIASPSSSGKSTSVASMLNYRNDKLSGHIITIEDPIEYVFTGNKSIFSQREVGTDTLSYYEALRNALRQRADVIFIGEIRDKDGMDHAINFAETGHLCVSTIHANNTYHAILRILNFYPEEFHRSILSHLSHNLEAILSQKLLNGINKSRVVASEVLLNVGLIKTLINDGKIDEIKDYMDKKHDKDIYTMEDSLINLVIDKKIHQEIAFANCDNPTGLKMRLANLMHHKSLEEDDEK